jgi:hypothetical protein
VLELFALLLAAAGGAGRRRGDLIPENRLRRHQLAVLTRPTRRRPRPRSGLFAPNRCWAALPYVYQRAA